MASLEAGSFQTVKPELGIQYKKNNVAVGAAYAHTQTEGWRQNSEYNRHNLNAFARYTGKHSSTELLVQFIKTKAYIPSSINEQTFYNAPDSAAPNWLASKGFEEYRKGLLGIKHAQKLGANVINTTVLFLGFKGAYEVRPFNILSEDAKNLGMRNVSELKYRNMNFQAGFEFMMDRYEWSIYESNSGNKGALLSKFSEDRTPLNLFLQTGINFKNGALLEAGLSYNFLSYSLTDLSNNSDNLSGSYSYNPVLSPYLGINVPIKKQWHVYGSVSHGFSAPSVEETLMPIGEINPDLKPETGWNMETGFRLNTSKAFLFLDANVYLLLVDNLLVTERLSEEIFYGRNAGSSQHSGFEVSSTLRLNSNQLFKFPQIQVSTSYNYSQPVFTQFVDNQISYNGNYLPGVPKQNFWTSVHLKYNRGLFGIAQLQYSGRQYLNDLNSEQYNGYLLTHFKLGYKIQTTKAVNYEFALGVKNAFDSHYASMILVNASSFGSSVPRYFYPGEPRNFYVSLVFGF
jgi:iron complex outermembrane receptor protein